VVGDAILDRDWLLAWMFFWPNHYEALDVVETWRSVAKILDKADVVIPGHGPPIRVDAELLQTLLDRFPKAFQAHWCPEVARVLRSRLERLGQTQGS
jgi:glyoxylase-like metal-dependent hydrolase (beta-lactamase superfamily II)